MRRPATLPDTNVILRYLLADVPEQFTTAKEFFEKVRTGVEPAVISESVLVECLYVLTKFRTTLFSTRFRRSDHALAFIFAGNNADLRKKFSPFLTITTIISAG